MRKPPMRGKNRGTSRKVLLCLLVCFPYGLLLMWRKARWPRLSKVAVTACFAVLTALILLPQTLPPARRAGGVQLVGAEKNVEVFGPELPPALDEHYAGYGMTSSNASVLAEVEEVKRTYVYVNANGEFYHKVNCKYVAWYSEKLTPAIAHFSGYAPCPKCGVEPYTAG